MRKDDFRSFTVNIDHEIVDQLPAVVANIAGQKMDGTTVLIAECADKDIAHDIRNALQPTMRDTYKLLATLVQARLNCQKSPKVTGWEQKHAERIKAIMRDRFPHGAGFDHGCHLDFDKSTGERLVIITSFHHMDENGMYDGWTEHTVTVTPSLQFGFQLRISGRDRNNVKDMITEAFL